MDQQLEPAVRVVVIGASAGGISALKTLVAALPPDLGAAVLVVLHMAPEFDSHLPAILDRAGPLPARYASDGEPLAAGTILVAPPDRHLLVRRAHVELSRGPRENHARPALDPTLRSAARAFGARVIGVVLTGMLGDGTIGLMAVKARGGTTVVQDPQEAQYAEMPARALQYAQVDYVLDIRGIAALVGEIPRPHAMEARAMEDDDEPVRARIAADFAAQVRGNRSPEQSVYTCPDCGGPLWQADVGQVPRFRCHQGHAYAPEPLLAQKGEEVENALWSATRALVERATLNRQLAARLRERGQTQRADSLYEQAEQDERHLQIMRSEILGTEV